MQVLLEDSGEVFRVTGCRSDMTVRELKEELDLIAGIPFSLQRLQYLDQGSPCPTPFPAPRTPSTRGAQSPLNPQWGKGSPPRGGPPDVKTNPTPVKPRVEKLTLDT
nr:ankyrin repeat domain-containing protein 60 [Globicephala melas]